jgi:hypothetical protein
MAEMKSRKGLRGRAYFRRGDHVSTESCFDRMGSPAPEKLVKRLLRCIIARREFKLRPKCNCLKSFSISVKVQ